MNNKKEARGSPPKAAAKEETGAAAKTLFVFAVCALGAMIVAASLWGMTAGASGGGFQAADSAETGENGSRPLGGHGLTSRRRIPQGEGQLRTVGTGWADGVSQEDMAVTIAGERIGAASSPREIERILADSDEGLEIEIRANLRDRVEGLARMRAPLHTLQTLEAARNNARAETGPEPRTWASLGVWSIYLSPGTAGLVFSVTNADGAAPALPMDAALESVTVFEHADCILGAEVAGPLGLRIGMTALEVSGIFGDGPTEFVPASGNTMWQYGPDGEAMALAIVFSEITGRVVQFTVHFR